MEFKAYKMDGLGNDFVIIDRRKNSISIINSMFPSKDLSKEKSHTIHFGNIEYENLQVKLGGQISGDIKVTKTKRDDPKPIEDLNDDFEE